MRMRFALLAAAMAVAVAGCGSKQTTAPPTRPSSGGVVLLNGAGASFPYPIYSKWFSEYNAEDPNVRISYQSIGSGGGIQQLKARTVDFGASDVPLTDAERREMPAPVVEIPTVAGGVAVVYNLRGPSASTATRSPASTSERSGGGTIPPSPRSIPASAFPSGRLRWCIVPTAAARRICSPPICQW
jgi:ABC-type phosphate transport system substrate-binding protein